MQGDPRIIDLLNQVLRKELTGINQYFIHSRMCKNWGYAVLEKVHYDEAIEERRPAALASYLRRLRERLRSEHVREKPGVVAVVQALARDPRVTLGLLTGNLEPGARLKVEPLGLNSLFPFGAYGSDHEDRRYLPAVAVERALAHTGHAFVGKRVVIVGDSIHDVRCGRSLGVRAVAVATGRTTAATLAAEDPDALLEDCSDLERALRAIVGDISESGG
jgi:phosphoglycolate phosphatase-like HAD superfamily hydrolase